MPVLTRFGLFLVLISTPFLPIQRGDAPRASVVSNQQAQRAVLWREPVDIETRDLFFGPGGREGAPDLASKFSFVRRSTSGTAEKIIVNDDRGRSWVVKFGPEAKPETTAARLIWAAGYHADADYFVKEAYIGGRDFYVRDVRFERRDDGLKDMGSWDWSTNPFVGKRELQGLKVLMALLNNWDLKDVNNKIGSVSEKGQNPGTDIYYVSDLGATLGSTGSFFTKLPFLGEAAAGTKGNADAFANQVFIDGVINGEVVFHYKGKNPSVLKGISTNDARAMGDLLGRLSEKQLGDAFRAGGFSDTDVQTYVRAIRSRIKQLQNLR